MNAFDPSFSLIIPVYNRPDEMDELLQSITCQTFQNDVEVIVVEDGSSLSSEKVLEPYREQLDLSYIYKENTGPGHSRNVGMRRAKGNYFIILDSDCLLPPTYLEEVRTALNEHYCDAFGGPDAAHTSFTTLQKAINYSMTSFFTTGGIRGRQHALTKFQPRSFNMGISRKAFQVTGGFSPMRTGEDIDLTCRLWAHGFETRLIEKGVVFHKRRTNFRQFFKQTFAFGKARPLLNKRFPETAKAFYWLPSLFVGFGLFAVFSILVGSYLPAILLLGYFALIFADSFRKNKHLWVALVSVLSTAVQFTGYGLGFLTGFFNRRLVS
jgi:GT2 family glycosyltransferase